MDKSFYRQVALDIVKVSKGSPDNAYNSGEMYKVADEFLVNFIERTNGYILLALYSAASKHLRETLLAATNAETKFISNLLIQFAISLEEPKQ